MIVIRKAVLMFWCGLLTSLTLNGNSIKPGVWSLENIGADSCSLDYYVGIDKVVLGKTTIKEIIILYGEKEIKRKKFPWAPGLDGRYSVKYISYPKLGLEFRFSNRGAKYRKRKVTRIVMSANCKCQSLDGVAIGTSYSNLPLDILVKEGWSLGKGIWTYPDGRNSVWLYKQMAGGGTIYINFIGDTDNPTDFVAKSIELAYNPNSKINGISW